MHTSMAAAAAARASSASLSLPESDDAASLLLFGPSFAASPAASTAIQAVTQVLERKTFDADMAEAFVIACTLRP